MYSEPDNNHRCLTRSDYTSMLNSLGIERKELESLGFANGMKLDEYKQTTERWSACHKNPDHFTISLDTHRGFHEYVCTTCRYRWNVDSGD